MTFLNKNKKRIAYIFIILILTFGIIKILDFCLSDTAQSYTRITIHEMYEADSIDTVFLGTSHCYRSFDPREAEEEFGVTCFNLGSSFQQLDGSFALLKEVYNKHHIKRAFVELTFATTGTRYKERDNLTSTYILTDYMKPGINKYYLLFNSGDNESWLNGLSIARRNHNRLFEEGFVSGILASKLGTDFFKYPHIDSGGERYEYKGFVSSKEETPESGFTYDGDIVGMTDPILSPDDIKYITKIVKFCKKKNIELHFVGIPMSDFYLTQIGNYDDFIKTAMVLTEDLGSEYVDFNLLRYDVFSGENSYFKDLNHLNAKGAKAFTNVFCRYYNNELGNEIFFETYDDKINYKY